jgi:hypothetical protein
MTTISQAVNKTVNTVATSLPGYGAVPPQLSGHVYTTNTTSGQFLTSTGSNGTTWTTGTGTINTNPAITVKGTNPAELEVKGRMIINGRDLEERLDTIEKVLQIPERDVTLEKKHPKLKKLYDEYIQALGKYRTFEAIKGDDNGTT